MSSLRTGELTLLDTLWAYITLTKPDVTFLVVITAVAGFYLGSRTSLDWPLLLHTLTATMFVAGGTAALNQYIERDLDATMRRTAARPIPAGILRPCEALVFGLGTVAIGCLWLALAVNRLSSSLALTTSLLYLSFYTPLKTRTSLATAIGAFPGALPPLIGWAAARGSLSREAWILFAILFCWQVPHFLSIAWMYREDYARAGIRMLPVVDPSGDRTFRQIVTMSAILVPVSLLPAVVGMASIHYFFVALVLGMLLLQVSLWAACRRTNARAKWLMHATVAHIPVLLGFMIFDKLVS
jgi:heme o synthase